MEELLRSSARSIARAIREKEASSEEVVRASLYRIEAVNPVLNAVVYVAADRALKKAREADAALGRGDAGGPLHGVPMTLKDSLDTAGVVTTGGTRGREGFVPDRDATTVARMRSAGAILLGKTNTPELTLASETDNLVFGRTSNPYDPSRSSGASSGGAGAIVAAAGSPMDLGSDTGGSIRLPSHFCGVAGLKPTSGRVPRTGHIVPFGMGAVDSLTQIGPMARYVEDLALIFPIIAGVDGRDPGLVPMPILDPAAVELKGLRVAFLTDNGVMSPTPETAEAVTRAAAALADAGANVVEDQPAVLGQAWELANSLSGADGRSWVSRLLEKAGTREVSPPLRRRVETATPVDSVEFSIVMERVDAYRSEMLGFMQQYDVILCPTCAYAAQPHGAMWEERMRLGFSYTNPFNLTGWPSTVVRAGTSADGMPIGVQAVAQAWREDVSLAVAGYIETALGGWKPPPI